MHLTLAFLFVSAGLLAHVPNPNLTAPSGSSALDIQAHQHHVTLPENVLDATFNRAGIDYHLLIGEYETTTVPGTTIELNRPTGSGVHVLEIGWLGSVEDPQYITLPSAGQVFLNESAIYVDFRSTDHTVFAEPDLPGVTQELFTATCDGTYQKVLSVTTSGDCWGARTVGSDGTESRKCNATTGSSCTSTITFNDGPPPHEPVNPVFECRGGGSIDYNPTSGIAHANKATDGTCN